jgi:hypothetical protein
MMVYAASVDSQDTMLPTVARISLRVHYVLLLVARRAVENILLVAVMPVSLLWVVAKLQMSRLKKLVIPQKS